MLILALLTPAAASGTGDLPGAGQAPPQGSPDATDSVTLVTGLTLPISQGGEGQPPSLVLDPEQMEGASPGMGVQLIHRDDHRFVVPDEALGLVGEELSWSLFDLDALIELDGELPVIVEYTSGGRGLAAELPGLSVDRHLESIDAVAGTLDLESSGELMDLLHDRSKANVASGNSQPGVKKIWLDEKVSVDLADSIPQIRADATLDAGYGGKGVQVAVLDTGIDAGHPDLTGRVSATANFTNSPDAVDRHGHGTHVAGIVAGAGVADGSGLRGVAPEAQILGGKVLNDGGSGQISWVIDGMEWAADQGADIVNMSLGSSPTDGSDPLSQAVNQLTEEHGVLFVVSAGNSGPRERTIGSPGSATHALTVAAVDDRDRVAEFSSRGPRLGDFLPKPDIAAPGVGIVAPRAAGTALGNPVNDYYTAASGTSMAAPHVAGAAASVKQTHPEFDATELRSALIGSATDVDEDLYAVGSGRLDAWEATQTTLTVDHAPLDLGYVAWNEDETVRTTAVTVSNHSAAPVEAQLDLNLTDEQNEPADVATVTPSVVTVPAGGSVTVDATLDVTDAPYGTFLGSLTATVDGEPVFSVPASAVHESERYDVTVTAIGADGQPAPASWVDLIDVQDRSALQELSVPIGEHGATFRVPPGRYSAVGLVRTLTDDNGLVEATIAGNPEIVVNDGDVDVVMDASAASPVSVEVDRPVELADRRMGWSRTSETGGTLIHTWLILLDSGKTQFSAQPTTAVTTGEFEFFSKWRYASPEDADPAYRYELVLPHDVVGTDLTEQFTDEELSNRRSHYYLNRTARQHTRYSEGLRPLEPSSLLRKADKVASPGIQEELRNVSDSIWHQTVSLADWRHGTTQEDPFVVSEPGVHRADWHRQPLVPTPVPAQTDGTGGPVRLADGHLHVDLAEFDMGTDRWAYHYGFPFYRDQRFVVVADDEVVADQITAQGSFLLPEANPEHLSLDLRVSIPEDRDWDTWMSAQTLSSWEINSPEPDAALPLLLVDYDIDLDLSNRAPDPRDVSAPFTIGLDVHHQPGVDGPAIESARAWVSYDEGDIWMARPVRETGEGTFEVVMDRYRGAGDYASLRVEAWDTQGNRIEQEVIRAYALRP